jgi:primosomal protein N' (replication factor Y)
MVTTVPTQSLFPDAHDALDAPDAHDGPQDAPGGPFAGVALETSIDKVLDYAIPARLLPLLQVGQRVKVPLGRNNRPSRGYVVSIHPTTDYPKIKNLSAIDDERVLVDARMMQLARWMGRYYVAPLGTVIESIVPSAVKKKTGLGYTRIVSLAKSRDQTQEILEKTKAPKRRAVLARLLQLPPDGSIELVRLASESGTTVATVRKLQPLGWISLRPEMDLPRLIGSREENGSAGTEPDIAPNDDQRRVLDELVPRVRGGGFSVNLLHGVTGSGKTEVYLQCIRPVIEARRQAIVLVPEIALTPQTVRRFTNRFKRVAVLHSGLTSTQRHSFWQQIAAGLADVVVGARSAVFAPVPKLGIVVVDEEHESSYKQDTAPRYHARDVAIKRGQLEDVPVMLGSATPSLESYHRVTAAQDADVDAAERGMGVSSMRPPPQRLAHGRDAHATNYHLLTLPRRVRDLALPHVELVDLAAENRMRRGVHLFSQRLEHLLRATLQAGHQAILLLNRRGYSNFVHCSSCGHVMQCKYCDTTMTYHRTAGVTVGSAALDKGVHTGQLHCHYCLAVNPLPDHCPVCNKKLSLFGLGTQRVEEELGRKFPEITYARVDSDSMRGSRDYEATLGRFARKEIQVLLGTQMIAKGLDYPNVTLVGVISGDTALALPDFRASERTFQLITQVAGRAGRGASPGRVVLQTFLPDDPTIRAAIKQDFIGFAHNELKHRREVGLPPFARMVRIVMRDQELDKLHKLGVTLAAELQAAAATFGTGVLLRGPMPCAISRIAGYFRTQIVLASPRASRLQQILSDVREKGSLAKSDRIAVDVDPVSLL